MRRLVLSCSFLLMLNQSYSQDVSLKFTQEPLNQVLISLRTEYGFMISFDDALLSSYSITADTTLNSVEKTLDYLFTGLPLKYEIINGVYIIYAIKARERTIKYLVSGTITDITTRETLPYSGIQINSSVMSSDARGSFSFVSSTDSVFRIRISYVGYYILDTTVNQGVNFKFELTPSIIAMKEIIVNSSVVARTIQAGSSPGIIRLNHKIAYYLPGNGDNSIFNLLRLQPGILAAGEQSADLIIWGSYEGQSQVIFDGFTLYGMKNFNDNISAVNPFMAKDIKVLKGGYGAEYGERVGGIVDITGTDGNRLAPSMQVCLNNMTINGLGSVPLGKNSALLMAYRQTYYDLYNPVAFSASGDGRGRQGSQADYYLTPDYRFRDMNLKYSGNSGKRNYYISLYGGKDNFSYDFDQETLQKTITIDHAEKNLQLGATGYFGFKWNDRNTSNLIISYSYLQNLNRHNEDIVRTSGPQVSSSIYYDYTTTIDEWNARVENTFRLAEKHSIDAGFGSIAYQTYRKERFEDSSVINNEKQLTLPYLYLQDNISMLKRVTLRPGIRIDVHTPTGRVFFQPRLSVLYRINDYLKVNTAAGLYNQFVAKNMIMESSGNYRLEWAICDNNEVSVLNSQNLTVGLTYDKKGFVINAEGYLKRTGGITRYLETTGGIDLYEGDGLTRGFDLFLKKDFKDQTFWVAYTLSKTMEHFSYFPTTEYLPAMHDQRHEIKLAALTRFRSFHFTVNYVFGSGFPDPDLLPETVEYTLPYSRLDAALIYKVAKRKIKLDAGVSVLNVLNRENIRYSNYTRIPTDETTTISLYAEAVPFTPSLFLNMYF